MQNGFVEMTPVQQQSIPPALEGQDIVATAQTGTGKTLGFVVPMLESLIRGGKKTGIQAVVLSPTRELSVQINETFNKVAARTGIRSALVVGGFAESHQLRSIRQGAQVVIATPGRLCDFLDRGLINLRQVRFFVLDEADRMLDMGFLPSIRTILQATPESRQTLLFSATIESSVAHLIDSYVRNPTRIAIGATTKPAEGVSLRVYEVEPDAKIGLLEKLVNGEPGSFLVFARTKHGADRVAKRLAGAGVKAARIHGGRTQNQRTEALNGFKSGVYRVLVATDIAARGLHVDGIGHVVNYDLPQAPEDFVHRVGRTGRAGAQGTASTFSTRSERGDLRRIERALSLSLIPHDVGGELRTAPARTVTSTRRFGPRSRYSHSRA